MMNGAFGTEGIPLDPSSSMGWDSDVLIGMCKARLWGGWLFLVAIVLPSEGAVDGYPLIYDGKLEQTIYVQGMEERVLREAVLEMKAVFERMVPHVAEDETVSSPYVRVVIGRPPDGARGIIVDPDSFPVVLTNPEPDTVVWDASPGRLVISGRGIEGTALAVYRFLDREGGVRWFWPGDLGREIPVRRHWTVPTGRVVDQPVFESRTISGLRGRDATVWGFRNGLRSHYPGLHGLQRIFSEAVFRENPEWAAIPFDPEAPPGEGSRFWKQQPNLANPEVAEYVGKFVWKRFSENPQLRSVSVGVADNLRYGDRAEVRNWVEPRRWFRGQPVYSDLIFGFANRVAEKVEDRFPERYLMALAYQWGEAVPVGPVHPMVIPLLTADRAGGYAVEFTVEDQELIREWRAKGTRRMSIYEYWHGLPHLFPRQAMVLWAARLRDARESGVELFRGELNPFWGLDGAKPWVLVRLLWDSDRDVKILEREFYGEFFGPAGMAVDAFFDAAEGVWMRQRGIPYWIRYYDDENGPLIFGEEVISEMGRWLERARGALEGSDRVDYGKRLAVVEQAFGLFRELWHLQAVRGDLLRSGDPSGLGVFATAVDGWWERYGEAGSGLEPSLRGRYRHVTIPVEHHLGVALAGGEDERLRMRREIEMLDEFQDCIEILDTFKVEDWDLVSGREEWEESVSGFGGRGLDSGGFKLGGPWEEAVDPFEFFEATICAEEGMVRLENALASGIRQRVKVAEGDWLWVSATIVSQVSPGNRSSLFVRWFDAEGRNLIKSLPTTLPIGEFGDESGRGLHLVVPVPDGIVEAVVYVSTVYQQPGDYMEIRDPVIRRWSPDSNGTDLSRNANLRASPLAGEEGDD